MELGYPGQLAKAKLVQTPGNFLTEPGISNGGEVPIIGENMNLFAQTSASAATRKVRPARTADANALFKRRLEKVAADTEALLDRLLSRQPAAGELERPGRLLEAMRYAGLGGGKRFRPFLVAETARLFDAAPRGALMVAAALECVHCYSLVHDDLPAMDDDALRRGRPTVHKAFDEATAILAGDGLLTFAFDILAREQTHKDTAVRVRLIAALARAAGIGGMAGGQMLDLAAEGRFATNGDAQPGVEHVRRLQAMKTGALLQYACVSGAILGSAGGKYQVALERYGAAVGEAFQIADDLLDIDGDAATVGKATGKDAAAHKATFVSLLGIGPARARLKTLVGDAEAALKPFGNRAAVLIAAARFVAERRN
jgi:farnesyl diphosphate synthase